MKPTKFSIIVPAYKRKFLRECLESIFAQSYTNFELILADDDSPENLSEIINDFLPDQRVCYWKNTPGIGGLDLAKNWNKCLGFCKGDFVICMGDDDRLLPRCLANYAELLDKHPGYGVYHARTQIINENSEVTNIQEARPETESPLAYIWNDIQVYRKQFIGDFLFSRKKLEKEGGFFSLPYAWGSDRISVVIAATGCAEFKSGIVYDNRFGFQYRENSLSVSSNTSCSGNKALATIKLGEWYENYLKQACGADSTEELYRKLALQKLPEFVSKILANDIAGDIYCRPLNLLKWVKNKSIDFNTLKRSIYYSLRMGCTKG